MKEPLQLVLGVALSIEQKFVVTDELKPKAGVASLVGPVGPLEIVGTDGGVVSTVKDRVAAALVFPSASAAVT